MTPGVGVRLDEVAVRLLAPNPSPMTLEGTNTYLLATPDGGAAVVVDPGPDLPAHRQAIERALAGREVVAVVVTHHHADHAQAAGWATGWHASLRAFDPRLVPGATPLADGDHVRAAGVTVQAVHTPGHSSDHLCLRVVDTDVVLTGDHVLGHGTSVVAWPDGDLVAYLASLERLLRLPATRLYPGHGPVLEDPAGTVRHYLEHRAEREAQVIQALQAGADSPRRIVERVYADVPRALHPAAERTVTAHLAKLVAEGRAAPDLLPGVADDTDPSRGEDR